MSGIATNGKVTAGGCYQIIKVCPALLSQLLLLTLNSTAALQHSLHSRELSQVWKLHVQQRMQSLHRADELPTSATEIYQRAVSAYKKTG